MERSSRNLQPSLSKRKFQVIFSSPNRYFTENSRWVPLIYRSKYRCIAQGPRTLQLIEKIRCIYAVLANKIIRCIFLCSCVFMSRFGRDLNPMTVNIASYQMSLLVWRVVNKTLKFRLTFLILLTINFPLTTTTRETRQGMTLK